MKRVILGFSVLALSTAFILSCKPEKDVPPTPDTEVESSVYASYANFIASDVEMICSYLGEGIFRAHPYSEYPGEPLIVPIVDTTTASYIFPGPNGVDMPHHQFGISWNNTRCKDGRVRSGSIIMYVPQLPNQRYARNHKFQARIIFESYTVDGWLIELADPDAPMYLYNTVATPTINTANTNLTWRFAGKFKMTHPTDINKNMLWDGDYNKTLDNTSNPLVYAPSQSVAVTWSLATIKYSGHVNATGPQVDKDGKVTPNKTYKIEINPASPLVRDFTCSPDKISGVTLVPTPTSPTVQITPDWHHPFKSGVASFTVADAYPRRIYYGNEADPQTPLVCDNTGEVLIKGISYRINFFK